MKPFSVMSDHLNWPYFREELFVLWYKVFITLMSVDETLVCDHSSENYRVVLSCMRGHFWELKRF